MTHTDQSHILSASLSDISWDNARALAVTAGVYLRSMAGRGAAKLIRQAEAMVRELIMAMAMREEVTALPVAYARGAGLPPLPPLPKESPILDAAREAMALLRGDAPERAPMFKWRAAERKRKADDTSTDIQPADTPSTDAAPKAPTNYKRRLAALMDALERPERYARKAAIWLIRAGKRALSLSYEARARLWDNAFIHVIVQAGRDAAPVTKKLEPG